MGFIEVELVLADAVPSGKKGSGRNQGEIGEIGEKSERHQRQIKPF